MSLSDPLGDMLTRIRNGQLRKKEIVFMPASRFRGNVLDVFVTKSSGSYSFDRSAKAAVITASPLPMPKTSALIRDFQTINLTLSPDD